VVLVDMEALVEGAFTEEEEALEEALEAGECTMEGALVARRFTMRESTREDGAGARLTGAAGDGDGDGAVPAGG